MHSSKKKTIWMLWRKLGIMFLVILLLAYLFNQLTDPYYRWRHYGAYHNKLQILKEIKTPKTIFVGGSSVLFGVNAEYYEKLSGKRTVNMGLHALKSPDIYLSCVEPYINKGDTVIIAFEYNVYGSKEEWTEYDDVGLDIAHLSGEYYKVIPPENRGIYCYQQLMRSFEKVSLILYSQTIGKSQGSEKVYLSQNINTYGDFASTVDTTSQNPEPSQTDFLFDEAAAKYVKDYIKTYQNNGADVYLAFAPIYHLGASEQTMATFYDKFKTFFGDIVLGTPTDWMLSDSEMFYDTEYHLTRTASLAHTEYYYEKIKQADKR